MGAQSSDYLSEVGPRKVNIPEFWIGKTDVTVRQFKVFCKATGYKFDWGRLGANQREKNSHPMIDLDWKDAKAFSKWVGGDLPTEAQWEKAARGTDGRQFPWGNDWNPSKLHCGVNTHGDWHTTAPVGSYPAGASPYGCLTWWVTATKCAQTWPTGRFPARRPTMRLAAASGSQMTPGPTGRRIEGSACRDIRPTKRASASRDPRG